ncbi:MAG: signal peptide peptidase SppA [Alphaproteobacteria bacterium]|uniref:Signal peptide peptidase SppA n=1 Tax=Candidatus Nitrobium versatile TaxID=2884831 RepID=A0A953JA37_9BACT|nr:signal peptide peptidase SppA [Candidatus Nitrobium versatile]
MKAKKICVFIGIFLSVLIVLSALVTFSQKGGLSLGERVAVVRVEGPLLEAKSVVDEIKGYVKDSSIRAIVLRVNSPGGGVVPSQEIYDEVRRAVAVKKVVVSMGAVAASGGYYISAPASRIIANPGTITGSIGVIMEVPNIRELMNKLGIQTEVIKSGKHKDIASVFRGIGKEEREILQRVMDDVHEQFISAVAEGRKMPVEKVRPIADGRIFSGRQAVQAGLVDELGDLDHAVKTASRMAGIRGEPEVVTKKEKSPILDLLSGRFPEGLSKIIPKLELKYIYMQ